MSFVNRLIIHNVLNNIDGITGRQFEFYTGKLFKLLGYHNIKITPASGDYGTDVIATNSSGITFGIQCKHLEHKGKIGYRAIEEANAGKSYYKLNRAVVLTNQFYTYRAINGARNIHVKLLDRKWLIHSLASLIYFNIKSKGTRIIQFLSFKIGLNKINKPTKIKAVNHNSFLNPIDVLGDKSMRVYSFILGHINQRTNKLKMSNRQIRNGMKKEYLRKHGKDKKNKKKGSKGTVSVRTISKAIAKLERIHVRKNHEPLIMRKRYGCYGRHSYLMMNPVMLLKARKRYMIHKKNKNSITRQKQQLRKMHQRTQALVEKIKSEQKHY